MQTQTPEAPASTTTIPPASRPAERRAAAQRRAQFPYRFPTEKRHLGGRFTVAENSARLLRYFYFARRLSHGLGSWTLAIPEFEVKVETGRHIFWHADAARRVRERLHEQEKTLPQVDEFRDAEIDLLVEEMLSAKDTAELLVGAHQVLGRALQTAFQHHMLDSCPVTDVPSIRVMKQILVDYEPMLAWADAAIEAYIKGGVDESRLQAWHWHLSGLLASLGGISGTEKRALRPQPLRIDAKPYVRGVVPERDLRFATFKDTGDYNAADKEPRYPSGSYEDERLRFIRTQRDEIDAIEAFGTFLWDIRFRDFQAEYDLARITWDEARHSEIGHMTLQAIGYDPYELPNRLTSSTCRGPMEPEYGMTEINMFGEVAVLRTIHKLIDEARERGDNILAHTSDYIRADERTHVRKGTTIIKHMTTMQWKDLELKTRELFTECLVALGAIKMDTDLFTPLSREEIERLVGE